MKPDLDFPNDVKWQSFHKEYTFLLFPDAEEENCKLPLSVTTWRAK
jgi:hypothetical protein